MGSFKLTAVWVLMLLYSLSDSVESCRNPYSCISSKECSRLHGPGNSLNKIILFRCGDRGKKVCCPPKSGNSHFPSKPETPSVADPRLHPNYHLLPKDCGHSNSPSRVRSGDAAKIGQYPWMVLLGYAKDKNSTDPNKIAFSCGGTLISNQYILTAAHCISPNAENGLPTVVRLGELNLDTKEDCEEKLKADDEALCADPVIDMDVGQITMHPSFSSSFVHDIALIRLMKPVTLPSPSGSMRTICLPIGLDIVYTQNKTKMGITTLEEKKYTVSGWGKTSSNSVGSRILQRASVIPLTNEECIEGSNTYKVSETQLCTQGTLNLTDACKGDSGGPLMDIALLPGESLPLTYQVGIVSLAISTEECTGNYPSVYTRVKPYINWILDSMHA